MKGEFEQFLSGQMQCRGLGEGHSLAWGWGWRCGEGQRVGTSGRPSRRSQAQLQRQGPHNEVWAPGLEHGCPSWESGLYHVALTPLPRTLRKQDQQSHQPHPHPHPHHQQTLPRSLDHSQDACTGLLGLSSAPSPSKGMPTPPPVLTLSQSRGWLGK